MNELILMRLAEESGFLNDVTKFEAFAVLLVKECAKFLDENSGSDCTNNVWYPEPEELLNHFGITE